MKSPGEKQPYKPIKDKPTIIPLIKRHPLSHTGEIGSSEEGQQYNPEDDPYELCDVSSKCSGPGHTETSDTNCIGYYCFGDEEKELYEKIIKSGKCDGVNDSPKDKDDCLKNGGRGPDWKDEGDDWKDDWNCHSHWNKEKCGGKDWDDWKHKNWCKWHHCNHENHNHKHNHNNDHHNYDTKNYYYYYTNDYNTGNHATVILQPDYSHSNNYHDIRVVIGDDTPLTQWLTLVENLRI